jgi:hypothetical protein
LQKSNIEKESPIVKDVLARVPSDLPKMLQLDPILIPARKERLLPYCENSKIDKAELKRLKLLTDIEDPRWKKSKRLTQLPSRPHEVTLKLLPSL